RDVDEEDPAPARGNQETADRRTGRGGHRADRGPDADRPGSALAGDGVEQEGERGRGEGGGAGGLEQPRGDEGDRSGRGGAEGGGDGEKDQTEEETALLARAVGDPAGGDEERGEDDRVAVEDPGEAGQTGAGEVPLDFGKSDVDDEEVEDRHEDADRDDGKGETDGRCRGRNPWLCPGNGRCRSSAPEGAPHIHVLDSCRDHRRGQTPAQPGSRAAPVSW